MAPSSSNQTTLRYPTRTAARATNALTLVALQCLVSQRCAFGNDSDSRRLWGADRQPPNQPCAGRAGGPIQQLQLLPAAHLDMMTASCTATVLPVCSSALVSSSSVVALLLCSSSSTRSASVARAASPAAISACRDTKSLCWATSEIGLVPASCASPPLQLLRLQTQSSPGGALACRLGSSM